MATGSSGRPNEMRRLGLSPCALIHRRRQQVAAPRRFVNTRARGFYLMIRPAGLELDAGGRNGILILNTPQMPRSR